jgi:hypothetical protein
MTILNDISFSFRNVTSEHLIIFAVGYTVVFTCLAFLWLVFYNLPKFLKVMSWIKKRLIRKKEIKMASSELVAEIPNSDMLTGEQSAAISMALYLYVNELHDEENRVLTIRKISRRYSPWSSKIYSVTNGLNKRF